MALKASNTLRKMESKGPRRKRQNGGLVTMPFIFGKADFYSPLCTGYSKIIVWFYIICSGSANEACEKLAVVGFSANMISYLTTQLHMPLTKAANTLTNFGGTSSLTPLLGAFMADAYAGRFWTITVASIIYQIVNATLLISCVYIMNCLCFGYHVKESHENLINLNST